MATFWSSTSNQVKQSEFISPPQDYENESFTSSTLEIAPWQIPHDMKAKKGGEDTYYISPTSAAVFDGVGGWASSGVDPRNYSYALAVACKEYAVEHPDASPLQILQYGYDCNKKAKIIGSCTAVVATVEGRRFRAVNVGDSGFLLIRNHSVVFRSEEQQHQFNMPYQLGSQSQDRPKHGELFEFDLESGDVVLLITDGVGDNIFDKDILEVLGGLGDDVSVQDIARAVSLEAYEVSKDEQAHTPFYVSAAKTLKVDWPGGKEDDITVVALRFSDVPKAKL